MSARQIFAWPAGRRTPETFAVIGEIAGVIYARSLATGEIREFAHIPEIVQAQPAAPSQPVRCEGEMLSIESPTLADRFAVAIAQGYAARRGFDLPSDKTLLPAHVWDMARAFAAAQPRPPA